MSKITDLNLQRYNYVFQLLRDNLLGLAGVVVITGMVLISLLAPFLSPYDPTLLNFSNRFIAPNAQHLFGTDAYGRDVLSVVLWGGRTDLFVALIVVLGSAVFGTLLGLTAGFLGGKIDIAISYVVDVFLALPGLVLAMAFAIAIGRTFLNLSIALMLASWPIYVRLVRSVVLQEKDQTYVQAARSLGYSGRRIALFHILPNAVYPVIVQSTVSLGTTIMNVAALSFIGFGFPVLTPEWGAILIQGQDYLFTSPWVVLFPSIFIFVTVLAFNLLGDVIRDILDPRLRSRM